MKNITTVTVSDIKAMGRLLATVVGLVVVLLGTVEWLDKRYHRVEMFDVYREYAESEIIKTEEKIVQVIESMQRERDRDLNQIFKAIKDASATALIIRRDTLLARGRQNLSPEDLAELDVLETKLRDLNIN